MLRFTGRSRIYQSAVVADKIGNRGQACDPCDSAHSLQRFRIKTIS
jgi:hypothetical protein